MATPVVITGLSGSTASLQEILGATGVNRGFRIPALSVDGVAVGTRDDSFGDLGAGTRQKEVAVVPGHLYEVDIDDPETRKRLSRRHSVYGSTQANWIEVPEAAGDTGTLSHLTSVHVRSLLTESSTGTGQSFISRGTPLQEQEILFDGSGAQLHLTAGAAVVVDLTNAATRRALRLHSSEWCVARAADGLVTVRGLMTTKSLPTSTGGYGLSSGRGFRIPVWESFNPSTTTSNLGYVNSTVNLQVDLTNANVRRALRRNTGRWIVVSVP